MNRFLLSTLMATVIGLAGLPIWAAEPSEPATQPQTQAPAGSPADKLAADIQAIQQAKEPNAAIAAYSDGLKIDRNNVQLHQVYVRKMVNFGLPDVALYPSQLLVQLDPSDGLAWGVIGYMNARRGEMLEALSSTVLAAQRLPDDPFVLRTAGGIIAWFDSQPTPPQLSPALKADLDKVKAQLADNRVYVDMYQKAKNAYEQENVQAAQEQSATTAPTTQPGAVTGQVVPAPSQGGEYVVAPQQVVPAQPYYSGQAEQPYYVEQAEPYYTYVPSYPYDQYSYDYGTPYGPGYYDSYAYGYAPPIYSYGYSQPWWGNSGWGNSWWGNSWWGGGFGFFSPFFFSSGFFNDHDDFVFDHRHHGKFDHHGNFDRHGKFDHHGNWDRQANWNRQGNWDRQGNWTGRGDVTGGRNAAARQGVRGRTIDNGTLGNNRSGTASGALPPVTGRTGASPSANRQAVTPGERTTAGVRNPALMNRSGTNRSTVTTPNARTNAPMARRGDPAQTGATSGTNVRGLGSAPPQTVAPRTNSVTTPRTAAPATTARPSTGTLGARPQATAPMMRRGTATPGTAVPSARSSAPRVSAPVTAAPRASTPAARTAAPRVSTPAARASAPRMSAPAGRASAPRMSAPRASAPRMSAPAGRSSAPRMSASAGRSSAPRMSASSGGRSAPAMSRGGGGGGRMGGGGGRGGGGGGHR